MPGSRHVLWSLAHVVSIPMFLSSGADCWRKKVNLTAVNDPKMTKKTPTLSRSLVRRVLVTPQSLANVLTDWHRNTQKTSRIWVSQAAANQTGGFFALDRHFVICLSASLWLFLYSTCTILYILYALYVTSNCIISCHNAIVYYESPNPAQETFRWECRVPCCFRLKLH